MRSFVTALFAAGVATAATPAAAQEVWVGIAAHGVDTPFSLDIGEGGTSLQAGYRFAAPVALGPIGGPQPHVLVAVNTRGDTSLVAAGLSWKLGSSIYARPGIGLAIHDGPSERVGPDGLRTDLGSRVLFAPEIAVGFRVAPRVDLEASWIHFSHAQIFGGQNPGLDIIGARAVLRF